MTSIFRNDHREEVQEHRRYAAVGIALAKTGHRNMSDAGDSWNSGGKPFGVAAATGSSPSRARRAAPRRA